MKQNFIDQDYTTTFTIDVKKQSWLFEDDHSFVSSIGAAIDFGATKKSQIILEGHVESTSTAAAISGSGDKAMIIVTDIGTVKSAGGAINVGGDDVEIDNRGRIEGVSAGIYAGGDRFHLGNSGYIYGTTAVTISGDGSSITNSESGEISGLITTFGQAGEDLYLNNYGQITPRMRNAFSGGEGNDYVLNRGYMGGTVSLGGGNDVFDTIGGSVAISRIVGGKGDDTLITDSAGYLLNEAAGEGYDTVKSTVTYALNDNIEKLELLGHLDIDGTGNAGANYLVGNKVDNSLFGLAGDDRLNGGKGNDILTGGEGLDTFVFSSKFDMDTITDFTHGEDTIDLSGWKKVRSFDDVLKRAEDHGDDMWIIAGKDMLVIEGQHKADMHADDFHF